MLCRVFQNPDGTVRIMRPNPKLGQVDSAFFDAETSKDASLKDLPFVDVEQDTIPTNSSRRRAWRITAGRVVDDVSVPDPPKPTTQAERNTLITAATTLEQLKAALLLP